MRRGDGDKGSRAEYEKVETGEGDNAKIHRSAIIIGRLGDVSFLSAGPHRPLPRETFVFPSAAVCKKRPIMKIKKRMKQIKLILKGREEKRTGDIETPKKSNKVKYCNKLNIVTS